MNLPPLHPALVHLPIAFVVLSFVADLVGKMTRRESLRLLGFWCMVAALLGGVATIAAGYFDYHRAALTPETQSFVEVHLRVGWTIAACLVALTIWRWRIRQQARRVVTMPYLIASFLLFSLTMFQGWYGGEMVYSAGAGVAAAGQGTESQTEARERLARVRDAITKPDTALGAPARGSGSEESREQPSTPWER
jgi:uncharacterized membrane protein